MRIVSWNIRAGGGTRAAAIAAQLAGWGADVVALCEFRATPPSVALAEALAARGLRYQTAAVDTDAPGANGVMVAARWPLRRLHLAAEPANRGRWLLARLEAPRPLVVGAMHVPNRVTGRKDEFYAAVLALLDRWAHGPAMLVGDTNSGRCGIDEETRVFDAREHGWIGTLERLGWADGFRVVRGRCPAYTWYSPQGGNGFRIDHAFVNRALQRRLGDVRYAWGGAQRRRDGLSDHAALLADLRG